MDPISPTDIRYIKLGLSGRWLDSCIANNRIELGYREIPQEMATAGDWESVTKHYVEEHGRSLSAARGFAHQLSDFYELGSDCLWITFGHGALWWAFAEPEVYWLGGENQAHGQRYRNTIGTWSNTDIRGQRLVQTRLSTKLTRVAGFRGTVCRVEPADYLVRRLNGIEEPIVAKALAAREQLVLAAAEMIALLHWKDFEVLVDLIFAHSGWQRVSELGRTLKDVDLILEQTATGERVFVQVKSTADNAVLQNYIQRFATDGSYDRMFFVCHTPKGEFSLPEDSDVTVWAGPRLAELVIKAGVVDWLVEKAA
jgi:hypothetical protein